ncbi:MAG: zinc ABC transporter substrate-binding protein [Chloroflexota bacterium]|nr:zinc ABC transporter substrate-binding protein [Chloroflexota bacterium]MDE2962142.1 zinc ABC transporter substrate-binding protein [Chloroflexota bacterium]
MNPPLQPRPLPVKTSPLRPALALLTALAAIALLLTACGGEEPDLPPSGASSAAGSAPPAAASPDPTAPPAAPASAAPAAPATATASSAPASSTSPASPAGGSEPSEPLKVVTGNAVLADLVRQVGGDLVQVHTLVRAGVDVHTWQSAPSDSVRIAEADLLVSNGTNLAAHVEDLLDNASSADAIRVIASEGLEPQELVELPFPGGDHHEMEHHDEHGAELAGRLLIGDGETGDLSVIDLETGHVHQNEFDLGSRAGRIYPTKSGRFAVAVSSDANAVNIIDGGIYLEAHGDHFDLVERDVSTLGLDLSGDRPVHLYVGGEWATVYYDGSGDIVLLNEHELEEEGDAYQPTVLNAGPHHGAAVPLEDDLFAVTIQHPDYAQSPSDYRLPIGAEIWDLDGHSLHRAEGCPDLHGDAGNGHMAVFGCTGGVLMVEAHDGHYHDAFIPAPAGSPDDFRLTSVWGYYGLDHFFALGSAVGLYVVEPEEGSMEQLIPATEALRPIQVALSHDGELLLVVMSDGELRMYEAHDLDLLASTSDALNGEIDPGFWARPHVATAPGHIFITNSGAGEVIALDAHDLEEVNHWEISGTPTKIAFVGILGEGGHEEEGHDDHAGHDDHGHDHGAGDPHFWQDPRLVVHYVNQITDGLVQADPDNAATYLDNSEAYIEELEALDAYIAETLASIPADHRVMVTFHDAFGYFGERYNMEVQAFVGGHGGDVSPDDIANVLELVEHKGLPAVFAETQFSDDALQQVAQDAGIQVGIIRSLPDDEYPEYIGMMRSNADQLAQFLR